MWTLIISVRFQGSIIRVPGIIKNIFFFAGLATWHYKTISELQS